MATSLFVTFWATKSKKKPGPKTNGLNSSRIPGKCTEQSPQKLPPPKKITPTLNPKSKTFHPHVQIRLRIAAAALTGL